MLCQPGDCKPVLLVSIGGKRVIRGGNGIVDGPVTDARWEAILEALTARGFGNKEEANARLDSQLDNSALNVFIQLFLLARHYLLK